MRLLCIVNSCASIASRSRALSLFDLGSLVHLNSCSRMFIGGIVGQPSNQTGCCEIWFLPLRVSQVFELP